MNLVDKSIKKNIYSAILALLTLIFLMSIHVPVFADDVGEAAVEIISYDFDAVVHKDHTYTISEKIKINVNGQLNEYRVSILKGKYKVDEIKVRGSTFNVQSNDYDYEVVIKSPKDLGRGEHTLNLAYTIRAYADNDKKSDLFYMNVLPTTFDTPIKNLNIRVLFPKDFVWNDMQYFAGQYGVQDVSNKISVKTNRDEINLSGTNIPQNFGIILKASLPKNYWKEELNNSWMSKLTLGLSVIVALCLVVLWILGGRDPKFELEKEVFPKGGIPPAEANYLINGNISVHDVVSMILYLGSKGFLKVVEHEPSRYQLFRLSEPTTEPRYIRRFYNTLFDNIPPRRAIDVKAFIHRIDNLLKDLSESVTSAYSGKDMLLITSRSKAYRITGILLMSFINALITVLSFLGKYLQINYIHVIALFVITAGSIVLVMLGLDNAYRPNWLVNIFMLAAGAVIFIAATLYVGLHFYGAFSSIPVTAIYFASSGFGVFMIYVMKARAEGNAKVASHVHSFRHFISRAKKSEVQDISKTERSYFVDMVPYAYAFSLLDKWGTKFKDVQIDDPTWFRSDTEAYKMDMKKYGSKAMGLAKNIDKFGRTIQSEHALYVKNHRNG